LTNQNASIAKLDLSFIVFKQNRSLLLKYDFKSELKPFSRTKATKTYSRVPKLDHSLR